MNTVCWDERECVWYRLLLLRRLWPHIPIWIRHSTTYFQVTLYRHPLAQDISTSDPPLYLPLALSQRASTVAHRMVAHRPARLRGAGAQGPRTRGPARRRRHAREMLLLRLLSTYRRCGCYIHCLPRTLAPAEPHIPRKRATILRRRQ